MRIPELRQVCWRVRAVGTSDCVLRFKIAGEEAERRIHAGPGLRSVTRVCSSAHLTRIQNGCALADGVQAFTVDHRHREISLPGSQAH